MAAINCWEYMKCGQEEGGDKVTDLGVCPVAIDSSNHGLNGGINSGRRCWRKEGTLCRGDVQGVFFEKASFCGKCDFFKAVLEEEGENIVL